MRLTAGAISARIVVSDFLKYHLENGVTIQDCVFRLGSEAYCDVVCEVRRLYAAGQIELSSREDRVIIADLKTGEKAKYQGETVTLDSPQRNSGNPKKKFIVYHDSGKKDLLLY